METTDITAENRAQRFDCGEQVHWLTNTPVCTATIGDYWGAVTGANDPVFPEL